MNRRNRYRLSAFQAFAASFLIAALVGCGSGSEKPAAKNADAHDHAGHDHGDHAGHDHAEPAKKADAEAEHAHVAPRGGLLVEVGSHYANLEVLLKDTILTVYLLDGHAENPVRVAAERIAINVTPAGRTKALEVSLKAVANDLTGEKVGDTSQFQATVPGLAGVVEFEAVIPELTLRGKTFKHIDFDFAAPLTDHDHGDHAHDAKPAKP